MRSLLIVLSCVALVTSLPLTAAVVRQESEGKNTRYYNGDGKYSVAFPASWNLTADKGPRALAAKSDFEGSQDLYDEKAAVFIFDIKDSKTLEEYVKTNLTHQQNKNPNYRVVSMEKTTVSGLDAIRLVNTDSGQGMNYKTVMVITVKDGKRYVITGSAEEQTFNRYTQTFDDVINSVRFE